VTVGVISDSYANLDLKHAATDAATDIAKGTCPLPRFTWSTDLPSGGTDEVGRCSNSCIMSRPARPWPSRQVQQSRGFAQNIRDLADSSKGNCQIIVDDLGWPEEPFFQDGAIAKAVNDVVTKLGVAYSRRRATTPTMLTNRTTRHLSPTRLPTLTRPPLSIMPTAPVPVAIGNRLH